MCICGCGQCLQRQESSSKIQRLFHLKRDSGSSYDTTPVNIRLQADDSAAPAPSDGEDSCQVAIRRECRVHFHVNMRKYWLFKGFHVLDTVCLKFNTTSNLSVKE